MHNCDREARPGTDCKMEVRAKVKMAPGWRRTWWLMTHLLWLMKVPTQEITGARAVYAIKKLVAIDLATLFWVVVNIAVWFICRKLTRTRRLIKGGVYTWNKVACDLVYSSVDALRIIFIPTEMFSNTSCSGRDCNSVPASMKLIQQMNRQWYYVTYMLVSALLQYY